MNPSACRISYQDRRNSWCGSGGICGYDDSGAALILTNAHVSGSPSASARRTARFRMPDGRNGEFDASEILAYGFSDRLAVDWAILRCPGVTAETGLGATPLKMTEPDGNRFQFSGSPRCVWPQTHLTVQMVGGEPAAGVRLWRPNAIGGQSGSNLRGKIGEYDITQLLLTWSWGGNGAGQETSQIYNNILNANNDGPERPEGLIELDGCRKDQLDSEYYECQSFKRMLGTKQERLEKVQSLPIWFDENATDPPPVDPVDPEVSECEKMVERFRLAVIALQDAREEYDSALAEIKGS